MGRIRSVKPEVCKHEGLFDLEKATKLPIRFAWVGLWTACDREGRFKWRPRALKADILPFDDLDFDAVLSALASAGFIQKYEADGKAYGFIPTWNDHQTINQRESKSVIPAPDASLQRTCMHVHARGEGKGKEGEGKGKEGEVETTPSNLVQKWYFYNPGGKSVGVHEIAAMYDEIRRHGISDAEIEAELLDPSRTRGEWPSKFRDRLISRKNGFYSGPKKPTFAEQLAEARKKREAANNG